MTQLTRLPIALNPTDRRLLESVAGLKGLKLSTWIRVGALEASRRELENRYARVSQPSGESEGS
jgi:hypothetical protein